LAEIRDTFDIDFLHHKTLARRHDLLWGAGVRFSVGRMPAVVPTLVFTPENRTDKLYSAFVQDEINILENGLWLTLGSKFVRTDFSGFDAEPSARLLWTPGPHQTWWTSVTRALRTPSDVEETLTATGLVSANPLTMLRLTPNRKFAPETLLGYEGGFRRLFGSKLHVDITAFHNRYGNSTEASSPHHQVVLRSSLDLPGGLEFSQTYRYVSDLPAQLVAGYGTADVRLSWHRIQHFEFSLVGQNLLQPHHAEYGGDPGPLVGIKRNVYGAITWRK
jgi:outer membrane receptor protein involved in Fe transport